LHGQLDIPTAIGLVHGGDEMTIELTVQLTPDELERVGDWHERAGRARPDPDDLRHSLKRTVHRISGPTENAQGAVMRTLRDGAFQRDNQFAVIDFLPSTRSIPLNANPSVDLGIFSPDRQNQERESYLDGYMKSRSPVALNNVPSYLLTLDYQNLVARRQELEIEDDYERVVEPFRLATSKRITMPEYVPDEGSVGISVELPSGHRHPLQSLSSGEQELLALQYFVRRLQAVGGVLLLDEPEQHLHPSLQASLLSNVDALSQSSQVLIVSHSAALIAAAPLSSLVTIEAPRDQVDNQAGRLEADEEMVPLLSELGLRKSSLIQADYVLILEGSTDERWLRLMFPAEMAHAYVVIAGSGSQVITMCRAYRESGGILAIPWTAIRDRDFLSDDQISELLRDYPELHVHRGREIESVLLDPQLVASVMSSIGDPVSLEEAREALDRAADPLTSDVVLELSRFEVARRFPPPDVPDDDKWAQWKAELAGYAQVNHSRLEALDAIRDEVTADVQRRWDAEKLSLADPKVIIKRLHSEYPRFRNHEALIEALAARIREEPVSMPEAARALREHLRRAQGLRSEDEPPEPSA
jgi:hypothetical protein